MKRIHILLLALAATVAAFALKPLVAERRTVKSVERRLSEFGGAARARLNPSFVAAKLTYPPARVALLGLKADNVLQVYAAVAGGPYRFVHSYPIQAASGGPGPKLREGDLQVPEGIYPIESLNPNSRYHVSLRVGYPNAFDRAQAAREQRTNLGGDIMIHGGASSVGCLAMGDEAAEELFTLAADVGVTNVFVVLAPVDFRAGKTVAAARLPVWTETLYAEIKSRLAELPLEN